MGSGGCSWLGRTSFSTVVASRCWAGVLGVQASVAGACGPVPVARRLQSTGAAVVLALSSCSTARGISQTRHWTCVFASAGGPPGKPYIIFTILEHWVLVPWCFLAGQLNRHFTWDINLYFSTTCMRKKEKIILHCEVLVKNLSSNWSFGIYLHLIWLSRWVLFLNVIITCHLILLFMKW